MIRNKKIVYFNDDFEFKKIPNSKVIFTNGCFDILHFGHLSILEQAKKLGDFLIVGLNSDISVKKIKGDSRPINSEEFRSTILSFFEIVDLVVIFDEDTPLELIKLLNPDLIVKGGDYTSDSIVGREIVEERGGKVVVLPTVEGYSTTSIINKIKS
jgi:rfaE bifunctional protein nucleotidyltransferase chain/domain